ncbi:hypothetical protein I79_011755 [Cricetulus griseus]|uniref:Uncharacterized protein n=1 Tax=Cricetulus griseus TaxID=10029 RepID=G3HM11_CRIGR|nr:hypothetical protein I79_011755 [Cricetulus griseus]
MLLLPKRSSSHTFNHVAFRESELSLQCRAVCSRYQVTQESNQRQSDMRGRHTIPSARFF